MVEVMEEQGISRPDFTSEEMADLVAYLYYLNYFDDPGDYLKGEKLFREKECVKCHSVGGKGGEVGNNLDRYATLISPVYITQEMWNHGKEMAETMKDMGIPRPHFNGDEIDHILAYIRGEAIGEWGTQQYMLPGNPEKGKKTYSEKGCTRCHSIRGKRRSIGPDLGKQQLQRSVTEIAGKMWNHGPQMWTKMVELRISTPLFTAEEMADLIAYLYFIAYFDETGDMQKGEVLFYKKGCSACHSLGGDVEKVGPNLTESEAIKSPIHLASAMWNHASTMEEALTEKGIPWPRFEENEMRDLVTYIQSQGRP
jgi:cytochrome c2